MTGGLRGVTLAAALLCVCLWGVADAVGEAKYSDLLVRKPKHKPTAAPVVVVDPIPTARPVDLSKLWGKWYLLSISTKCPSKMKYGAKLEPTFIQVTAPDGDESSPISVTTSTRFNHDCWEINQNYYPTETEGRYLVKGKAGSQSDTEVTIMDMDGTYAFIRYRKNGMVTLKLYARIMVNLSGAKLTSFNQLALGHDMTLAYQLPFPNFGHCGSVDKHHVINCIPFC